MNSVHRNCISFVGNRLVQGREVHVSEVKDLIYALSSLLPEVNASGSEEMKDIASQVKGICLNQGLDPGYAHKYGSARVEDHRRSAVRMAYMSSFNLYPCDDALLNESLPPRWH